MRLLQLRATTWKSAFGYALLLSVLAILLAITYRIGTSVPVLRQQHAWLHCWALHDFPCERVSIELASKPGKFRVLDYNFSTKKLEISLSENRRSSLFHDKDRRFEIARAPSKYSFSEAIERITKGERILAERLAKKIDEAGNVVSTAQFSMDSGRQDEPVVLAKQFAVSIDHDQVYVVDIASKEKATKKFPFPCEEKNFLGRVTIDRNHFGRMRKVGETSELDLFEVLPDGEVTKIKTWAFVRKKDFVVPGLGSPDSSSRQRVISFRDRIYSPSAIANEIEVRTVSGEWISSFSVPGLDLATGNWDWHQNGNFISWEEKNGEFSYFDIEKQVPLNLPTSVALTSFQAGLAIVGHNDLILLPGFADATTLVPQILIASRSTGQIVAQWPQRPSRNYSLIENGNESQILESGYEWGLSFVKCNIFDGTVVEAHYPLWHWFVWTLLTAIAVIAWSIAWLFYSARNGGVAWMDIALVSTVLIGVAAWRLYSASQPYSISRLPYEYGGGVFAGLMAVACMQVAGAKRSIIKITAVCVVFALGHLLLANLLNEKIYRSPSKRMWSTVIHDPDHRHVAMSTLATMTLMTLTACFVLFAVGFRSRCLANREKTAHGRSFQFSIREFLWLIVLVALISQPLSISNWSFLAFRRVPWWDVLACSAVATAAISMSLALALSTNKKVNCIGWVLAFAHLIALLCEFSYDFAIGHPVMIPAWRVGRAVMAAAVTAFVFADRILSLRQVSGCHNASEGRC